MTKQNQKVLIACDLEAYFRSRRGLLAQKSFGLLLPASQLEALSLLHDSRARLEAGEILRVDFATLLVLQHCDTARQRAVVPFTLMTTLQDLRQALMTLRYWGWEEFSFGVFFFDGPRQSEQDRLVLAQFGYCVMNSHCMDHILHCPGAAVQFPQDLSVRERQLLDCLGLGMTNAEIARELSLPLTRVKTLVRALLARLNLENRTCAAILAYWMRVAEAEEAGGSEGKKRKTMSKAQGNRSAVHCHEKGVAAVLEG